MERLQAALNAEVIEVEGAPTRVIAIFGSDEEDVLYVRIREEYGEYEEEAIARARRIAHMLTPLSTRVLTAPYGLPQAAVADFHDQGNATNHRIGECDECREWPKDSSAA